MRVIRVVSVTIALVAIGLGLFSYLRARSFRAAIPAIAPPNLTAGASGSTSTIVLPIRISLDAVRAALEAGVSPNGVQEQHNTIPVLRNDTTKLTWTRGPFALTGSTAKLTLGTALSSHLRVDGKILIAHVHAEADVKGTSSLAASPVLREDWTIKPNLSDFRVDLDDAQLDVAGVHIGVRGKASELIRDKAAEKLPALEARIAADEGLRDTVAKEWVALCASRRIASPDPSIPPTFVEMMPVAAMAAQPHWDDRNVDLVLGVEASLRLTDQATEPRCPFPAKLRIVPPPVGGRLDLRIPIDFTFDSINRTANRLLAGRTFKDVGRGMEVEVHSISILPSGARLLASADLTVRKTGVLGFLQGRASGTVYVLATPVLDPGSKTLRLSDARLDVDSNRALTSVFGQAAAAAVESVLSREAGFDYGRGLDQARARVEAAVADLNAKRGPVKLDLELRGFSMEGLAFDRERITITVLAEGGLRSELVSVPLSPR